MSAPFIPPRNTSSIFSRLAGGLQGAAGGRMASRMSPIFTPQVNVRAANGSQTGPIDYNLSNKARGNAGVYGTGQFRGTEGKNRYKEENIMRHQYDSLLGQENYRTGREVNSNQAYDAALADPRRQAQMFQQFYADQTNAIAAPILRQFQQTLANSQGANASRFGGQGGSTEQARGEFGTSDVFSRNLAEVIQANAAQGVNAGMDFTQMLGQRAQAAAGNADQSVQNVFNTSATAKKKGGGIGGFIGSTIGAGVGALAGNPGFGAAAGKAIFGGG